MPSRPQKTTDEYLQAFQLGEEDGFNFLFREYYAALCYFSFQIIQTRELSEEIAGEAFVKLWERHASFNNIASVKSFLYTVARNRCVDSLRKKKVMKKAELQLIKSNSNFNFEYFDEVAFAEMIRQIVDHIEELPSKMRQVFKLYYIEGKKYKQIACELNSSPEAVRKQKTRALKIIREKFLFLLSFF